MQGEYALYIDGRFITGGGRLTEPVFDPATSEALDKGRELFVPRYLKEFGYDRAATSVPGPA
jgi:hypothetical protein